MFSNITGIHDRFWSALIFFHRGTATVLGFPRMVNFKAAVELDPTSLQNKIVKIQPCPAQGAKPNLQC